MRVNDAGDTALDRAMAALADPTRRAILRRLTRGEARITELAEPFDLSLNAISKHIQVLERAALVTRRRQWREHIVAINPEPLDNAAAWIEQTRAFWDARLNSLESVLHEEDRTAQRRSLRTARTPLHERKGPSR